MLLILGKLTVQPEKRDGFLAFARATLPLERATPGCLGFDFYADLAVEDVYLMIERWTDGAALDAYMQTDTYHEHEHTLMGFLSDEPAWEEYEV